MPTRRERYLRFLVVALQLIVALVAAAAALLVLVPAQTKLLWMLEIIAREQGHWFALLTIAVAAIGLIAKSVRSSRAQRVAIGISLIAGLVLLKPTVQAILVGRSLPARLATVGDTTPRATSAAPARHAPVQFATLFTGMPVHSRPRTLTYAAANGDTLRMDFVAAATKPAPLVVVIHGGSWRSGSRVDLPELGQYLADRGYAVAAVSYRFAPRFQYPAAREDVRRAILYLEQNGASLGIDPSRLVLVGRSAGAHLALLSAYADRDPAIRGVVGLYPPIDLRWAYAHPSLPTKLRRQIVDQQATLATSDPKQDLDLGQAERNDQQLILAVRCLLTAGVLPQPDAQIIAMRAAMSKAPGLIAPTVLPQALGQSR